MDIILIKKKTQTLFVLIIIIGLASCDSDKAGFPVDTNIPEIPTEPTEPDITNIVATISIQTENFTPITSKKDYINCEITIDGKEIYENYTGTARIRGRGNSTWLWYNKKPYRIKLDKKSEILGLASNKDWVLLANYRDPTHLMHAFAFEMATYMGLEFTNHTRYVEVTLNGDYIGLYQLTEQVEVAKSRVNIDDEKGYLLSLDLDDGPSLSPDEEDNFWSEVFGMPICVKSPKNQTPQQLEVIKADFAILEKAINNYDYDRVSQLLDIKSFIDFLIIQEFTYNVELAAPRSMYMHKDKGGKYVMGPVWDFDAGFDFDWNTMYTGHNYFNSYKKLVLGTDPANQIGGYNVPRFFTQMFRNTRFVSEYKAGWAEINPDIINHLLEFIDETANYTSDAMERDYKRWPIDRYYKTEIQRLKTWTAYRATYLTTIISNLP